MTKNIIVVDQFGKEYASTYAKRAKGLVKNGRARWMDGNTICLVCPPDTLNLEDDNMDNKAENMKPINEVCETEKIQEVQSGITTTDILSRIDMIIDQGNSLQNAVNQMVNSSSYGGENGALRAKSISGIYSSREVTNQKMIDLLNRMYNDIAPRSQLSDTKRVTKEGILQNIDFAGVQPQTAELILEFVNNLLM